MVTIATVYLNYNSRILDISWISIKFTCWKDNDDDDSSGFGGRADCASFLLDWGCANGCSPLLKERCGSIPVEH